MNQLKVNNYIINLDKKDVKNINLRVKPNGLIFVSCPGNVENEKIIKLIADKNDWIERQISRFKKCLGQTQREYVSGEDHFVNGKRYVLKVSKTSGKQYIVIENKKILRLYVRENSTIKQREKVMKKYYKNVLTKKISFYLKKWIEIIGVDVNSFSIRKMKTRWGSCNIQTHNLLFNLELGKRCNKEIEYVVVHELIHLKERKHNDNFYYLLMKYLPNWKSIEQKLNFVD